MGLAVADDATGVASPLEIAPYEGAAHAARRIAATLKKVGATCVVLGLPTRQDGSPSPACRRSEKLAAELEGLGVEVVLQREFLSTNEAHRRAQVVGRQRRQPVDDLAAQVILEEFLRGRTESPKVET